MKTTGTHPDACDLPCLDLTVAEDLRTRMPPRPGTEPAAAAAEAPADPTRLSVAAALAEGGELCVCDLARTSGPVRNLVSHHLRRPRGGAGRLPPGGPAGVSRAHRPRPCSGQGRPQPGPGRTP